jgi:hypothetical protein
VRADSDEEPSAIQQGRKGATPLVIGRVLGFFCLAWPALAQYAGPAVLSRGEAPTAMSGPTISFQPTVSLNGVYDTGLAGVSVNERGDLANDSSAGVNLGWGVSGLHRWRHTTLGVSYLGTASEYFQKTYYTSINQSLLLGISHQLTRHITFSIRESAGTFSRDTNRTGLQQSVQFDPSTTYTPTTDYFDNRTSYLSTQTDLRIQKSSRMSFDMGGDFFLTRRRSTALYGNTGESARGDVQYRLSRRTTIGALYTFSHYSFTRTFGGSYIHGAAASLGIGLSARTELTGFAGAMRAESQFVEVVPLDPVIAILLGIGTGTRITDRIVYSPYYNVRLSRTFSKGVAKISAGSAFSPGNGLFQTSTNTTISAGYGYTGFRRWSVSTNVSHIRSESQGATVSKYSSTSASFGVSRRLLPSLHMSMSYAIRRYSSPAFDKYNRVINSVSAGLTFVPGDVPLRLW